MLLSQRQELMAGFITAITLHYSSLVFNGASRAPPLHLSPASGWLGRRGELLPVPCWSIWAEGLLRVNLMTHTHTPHQCLSTFIVRPCRAPEWCQPHTGRTEPRSDGSPLHRAGKIWQKQGTGARHHIRGRWEQTSLRQRCREPRRWQLCCSARCSVLSAEKPLALGVQKRTWACKEALCLLPRARRVTAEKADACTCVCWSRSLCSVHPGDLGMRLVPQGGKGSREKGVGMVLRVRLASQCPNQAPKIILPHSLLYFSCLRPLSAAPKAPVSAELRRCRSPAPALASPVSTLIRAGL